MSIWFRYSLLALKESIPTAERATSASLDIYTGGVISVSADGSDYCLYIKNDGMTIRVSCATKNIALSIRREQTNGT